MSINQSKGEAEVVVVVVEDLMEKAAKAADELYNIRDTYFPGNPNDKTYKLQTESDLALKLLDSILPGTPYCSIRFSDYIYIPHVHTH